MNEDDNVIGVYNTSIILFISMSDLFIFNLFNKGCFTYVTIDGY